MKTSEPPSIHTPAQNPDGNEHPPLGEKSVVFLSFPLYVPLSGIDLLACGPEPIRLLLMLDGGTFLLPKEMKASFQQDRVHFSSPKTNNLKGQLQTRSVC